MNNVLNILNSWDTALFKCLNGVHSEFWDFVMYWASDKFIWIPLYLIFLYLLWRKYKGKIWLVVLFAALLVFLSDQISVHLFKNVFERLRPSHEPGLQDVIHLVNNKQGGQFGFYSSHASNVFAIAVFMISLLPKCPGRAFLIIVWASLIAYSRVYLGLHYPGDVIAGAIMGALLGWVVARFVKNLLIKSVVSRQ